jgi:hypothetical protein
VFSAIVPVRNAASDGQRGVLVLGPHGAGETERRVIRDRDRVVDAVVRDDDRDGTEDLLARDAHVVRGHRRRAWARHTTAVQVGRAPTADLHGGALLGADTDVVLDALAVRARDHGTDHHVAVGGIADRQRGDLLRQRVDDLVVARTGGEDPRLGRADLALEHRHAARDDPRYRLIDVHVVEHDRRGLAAQLERDPADVATAELGDALADRGAAREADLVDARVGDEPLALRARRRRGR